MKGIYIEELLTKLLDYCWCYLLDKCSL